MRYGGETVEPLDIVRERFSMGLWIVDYVDERTRTIGLRGRRGSYIHATPESVEFLCRWRHRRQVRLATDEDDALFEPPHPEFWPKEKAPPRTPEIIRTRGGCQES